MLYETPSQINSKTDSSISIAGVRDFNREYVYHFFDLLEKMCAANSLDAKQNKKIKPCPYKIYFQFRHTLKIFACQRTINS